MHVQLVPDRLPPLLSSSASRDTADSVLFIGRAVGVLREPGESRCSFLL